MGGRPGYAADLNREVGAKLIMLWLPRQFFRRFLSFQDKAIGARICLAIRSGRTTKNIRWRSWATGFT
jgi:hypothetical protein